jgi:hypothetical protein
VKSSTEPITAPPSVQLFHLRQGESSEAAEHSVNSPPETCGEQTSNSQWGTFVPGRIEPFGLSTLPSTAGIMAKYSGRGNAASNVCTSITPWPRAAGTPTGRSLLLGPSRLRERSLRKLWQFPISSAAGCRANFQMLSRFSVEESLKSNEISVVAMPCPKRNPKFHTKSPHLHNLLRTYLVDIVRIRDYTASREWVCCGVSVLFGECSGEHASSASVSPMTIPRLYPPY